MAADKAAATGADLGDGLRKRAGTKDQDAPVAQPEDNKKLAKKVLLQSPIYG